jgi:hypothetical protein
MEARMLNLIGATVGMMAVAINLVAMAGALPLSSAQRLVLAGGAGAWVLLSTGLGAAGALVFSPEQKVPLIGVMFAVPLLAGAALWFAVPKFRAALMGVPMSLLIGLNAMRIFGALFLVLAAFGRLSGPFPYSAGWGDYGDRRRLRRRIGRSHRSNLFRTSKKEPATFDQDQCARRRAAFPP